MKKLPDKITSCGMCPCFLPSRQNLDGECSLLLVRGDIQRQHACCMPGDCPLDDES